MCRLRQFFIVHYFCVLVVAKIVIYWVDGRVVTVCNLTHYIIFALSIHESLRHFKQKIDNSVVVRGDQESSIAVRVYARAQRVQPSNPKGNEVILFFFSCIVNFKCKAIECPKTSEGSAIANRFGFCGPFVQVYVGVREKIGPIKCSAYIYT